jgi:hypothetical protein
VPESPQSLYTICRLYTKEDILCSDQGSIPKGKCQKWAPKVALPPAAAGWHDQSSAVCRPRPPMAAASTPFKNGSTCPAPFLPHVVHNPSPCSTELPRHSLLSSPLLCCARCWPRPRHGWRAELRGLAARALHCPISCLYHSPLCLWSRSLPFSGPSRRRSRRARVTAGRRRELARSSRLGPPPA